MLSGCDQTVKESKLTKSAFMQKRIWSSYKWLSNNIIIIRIFQTANPNSSFLKAILSLILSMPLHFMSILKFLSWVSLHYCKRLSSFMDQSIIFCPFSQTSMRSWMLPLTYSIYSRVWLIVSLSFLLSVLMIFWYSPMLEFSF